MDSPQLDRKLLSFEVTVYGNLEKINDVFSKSRVRIFYKYMNRNRTYITDEFAQKLIDSLPYAPVKGIFNTEEIDFTDHGELGSDGKIYGIVTENPNFAWEDHLDSDGVTRTYACADVLLYTALYPEAKLIPGSSQSMEIYDKTCQGEWKIWPDDGLPYFEFSDGCLLGLQVLGARTEPCFEGAAFFSLYQDVQQLMKYLEQINTKTNEKEEKELMEKNLFFRLSDNEKADLIWSSLNPNFNEEGGWQVDYYLLDVYDDYALAANSNGYVRVPYTKNEDNTITLGDVETVYIVDVTESEKLALDALKAVGGTYEAANIAYTDAAAQVETLNNNLTEKDRDLETLKADLETANNNYAALEEAKNNEIITLNASIDEMTEKFNTTEAEKVVLENEKNDLTSEIENLKTFKKSVEDNQKMTILANMSQHLNEALINSLKENMDNYSVADFEKEVNNEAVKNNSNLFSRNEGPDLFYKGSEGEEKNLTGIERLLSQHKNKMGGNK